MPYSHTITISVQTSGPGVTRSRSYTAASETLISEAIPNASTDEPINVAIDVSEVKSFYIVSDRAVTIETNDGSSPDDTIVLVPNLPYFWNEDSYDSFLLTADVTVLYVTNASGSTANIEIRLIQDPTP